MASHYEAPIRKPLVTGDKSYHDVTIDVAAPVEGVANRQWWIVFGIALTAFLWGVGCIIYTISTCWICLVEFVISVAKTKEGSMFGLYNCLL